MAAWREAPCYSEIERAALAWAEAVTKINGGLLSNEIYMEAKKHFTEAELVDLTMAVVGINSYNRLNFTFGKSADEYQP